MKNLYFESDNDFHNAIYPFKKLAEKLKKVTVVLEKTAKKS